MDANQLREEQRTLREELRQLKQCQLQYFTLSVTGTAALLGYGASQGEGLIGALAVLAPLAIVLPCWWIFFDKATTITRIVGYYRVIERMIAGGDGVTIRLIGYERALALYRSEEDGNGRIEFANCTNSAVVEARRAAEQQVSIRKIRHRYWEINWWTYFASSCLCCLASAALILTPYFRNPSESAPFVLLPVAALCLTGWLAYTTGKIRSQVTVGVYSYDMNYAFWEYIHVIHANK